LLPEHWLLQNPYYIPCAVSYTVQNGTNPLPDCFQTLSPVQSALKYFPDVSFPAAWSRHSKNNRFHPGQAISVHLTEDRSSPLLNVQNSLMPFWPAASDPEPRSDSHINVPIFL